MGQNTPAAMAAPTAISTTEPTTSAVPPVRSPILAPSSSPMSDSPTLITPISSAATIKDTW